MKKINLKSKDKPIKIKMKKYFDDRGYFQEIFLKKLFNLDVKFTAVAKSKKMLSEAYIFSLKISRQNLFLWQKEKY